MDSVGRVYVCVRVCLCVCKCMSMPDVSWPLECRTLPAYITLTYPSMSPR